MYKLGEVTVDEITYNGQKFIRKDIAQNGFLLCPKLSVFKNRYKIDDTHPINLNSITVVTLESSGNGYIYGENCKETSYSIRDGYVIPDAIADSYLIKYTIAIDGIKLVNDQTKFPDTVKISFEGE